MDDLTLLDLLECPVCFEKLDVTAKVLPCQHTFCKPCLQRIFKAHKELRCPECRTLVFCSIEALPANLLLVRLLDGVRSGQNSWKGGSFRRPRVLTLQDNRKTKTSSRSLQASPFRLVPSVRIHMDGVPRAKALCNYRGKNPGDLKFNKGDVILLRRQLDENWYQGEINGVSGIFPASSVEVIKQLPQPPPLCRALYNFELRDKDKSENQDCLTFLKPNLTARHLLEKNKGHQLSRTKNLSLMSSPSRGKATNTPTLRKSPGSRRKGSGQFSITTALNTLNRMVHSPEGHQMVEISTPVLISSSSPSAFTQPGDKADFPANSAVQVSTSQPAPASPGHSTAMVSVPSSQQQLSTNMFVALHTYSANGPEELDLQKGEGIKVLGKYQDGWLRGLSLVTGRAGIFPSDYVIPVFSSTARKTSSFPDPRSPTVYTTWALPTSSVSSQGSFSEGDPRQNRPFKSVFVPTAVVNPAGSTASPGTPGQGSHRKGRNSMRKNGSLQRPVQSGIPTFMVGSLRRSPTMVIRPHKFQFCQPQGMTSSPAPMMVEMGSKPISTGEPALTCSCRGGKTRIHSAASSLIMEGKEIPIKSEPPPKPPASAPPSILVKPENSKNGTEKQVKTVRFQNYSPPPNKHYAFHATSGKHEQPATLKGSQPEAVPSGAEMTVLFAHRSGCHSGQQTDLRRKSAFGKTMPPVSTASATQTILTSK
ncbi:E3 ubiquitin-protein ligase SH3RF2-like isoform X2 [Microtus oregoni]|uniref:E3 ubiquitin-protein ligase SH3RF2-like isoform X2 n=1 Tax=Microtus oregoni TaxID=111838 RepID=UPI001BB1CCEF|nr:E3 ubiquitin-protein ligase SH3RF2-like isoform X2 [Microtus oregoni]